MPEAPAEDLNQSLKRAESRLPLKLRPVIQNLREKSPIVIAPVDMSGCGVCRNSLPTATQQAVNGDKGFACCPSCGRVLYVPDDVQRQTGKRTVSLFRTELTGIAQYSSPHLIIPKLKAKTMREAINELAMRMEREGYIADGREIAQMAMRREKIAPSTVERAMAFPHVRGINGGGLVIALGMRKSGLDIEAPDGKRTKMFFFSIIPSAASNFYLKVLGDLVEVFQSAANRNKMLAASDEETAWQTLCDLTEDVIA